ncbi:CubicO group peptidase (beta-lactamase class C family) [Lacinutrix venerupis]|uniref:serine hydrolase domain-containing protein n=1 Tax=Lacinutrix venerupis TaxID=1486034 RepID=UPI000EB20C2C|nr:serine hydrolase [Lacinutrix venerupis]RLJ64408.1 CubicO group peptidase (beta-lactamase class C family) [Lacinutrix venerupis]
MKNLYIFFLITILSCSSNSTNNTTQATANETDLYFPPLNSSSWDTKEISNLNWNENNVQSLLDFLNEKNTKSFIVLHRGKIVIEHYFNGHAENTNWYWASAGKTLTTTLTGIAQDDGLININNKVSNYLGTGWTSAPLAKEDLISCKNLLTMTSGLDDSLGESVSPENLQYIEDAGQRWAYHNVYVKLQDVVAQASNQTWTNYFNTKLKDKIGMSGAWIMLDDLNVYFSNTRSMARFGLLISNNGKWEDTQIVSESFINDAINTSQNINESYGYLWWLNGKNSFHLPQSQFEFNGELIPNAPNDMYAALGKNDQKIYIIPSRDLVIIRMGEAADDSNFALSTFDNELWEKINLIIN